MDTAGIMELPEPNLPRSALAQEIAKRFTFLRRVVVAAINRALSPLGATAAQYQVLLRLAMDGAVSQQELTVDAGLDAAGVSRLVAKMAEQKLVSIRVDAKDRRRRLVRLTPKGFAMVESLSPVVDASARKVVVGLTEAEEVRLLQLLDKAVISTAKMHAERRTRRKDSDAAGLGAGLGQPSEGLAAGLAAARLARMAAASVDEIVDEDDDPSSDT
jgi:DNA-binding MarR family transcriptional regulator